MSAILVDVSAFACDQRDALGYPSRESRIHAGLVSDIVSAIARNRPTARIECNRGTMDVISVLTEALADEKCGAAFVEALGDVLSGKDASKLADWVQLAATTYADHQAELISLGDA